MKRADWECSECGSWYWPDPESTCESCRPYNRNKDYENHEEPNEPEEEP